MILIENIESGKYKENTKIPSEQELCEKYNISRPTVRQAIAELTNCGYLYKEKGKGTFVSRKKVKINIDNYSGFSNTILDSQETGNRTVLLTRTIDLSHNEKLKEIFCKSNNFLRTKDLAEITFNQTYEGNVISHIISYIPLAYFPNIIDDVIQKKPVHEIFIGKYPLLPVKAKSSLEVVYADEYDSQFFQIQTGQALIKVENMLVSKNNQVVEYSISKYRADKCKLLSEYTK